MLADVQARHDRRDRLEIASIIARSVGLEVVRLHVRWSARQPEKDDGRLLLACLAGLGAQPVEISQAQTPDSERPGAEEAAS